MSNQDFTIIVSEFGQQIVDAFRPVGERFAAMGQEIYDAMYDLYVSQGAIYGESQEGMLRWMEELNEIARLRSEAQRMENHHAMLRDFKEATNKST